MLIILQRFLNELMHWMLPQCNSTIIMMIWKTIKICRKSTLAKWPLVTYRIENQCFVIQTTDWQWKNQCNRCITWEIWHGTNAVEPGTFQGKCKKLNDTHVENIIVFCGKILYNSCCGPPEISKCSPFLTEQLGHRKKSFREIARFTVRLFMLADICCWMLSFENLFAKIASQATWLNICFSWYIC